MHFGDALLLTLATGPFLSGCTEASLAAPGPDASTSPDEAPVFTRWPWSLIDCDFLVVLVPIPAARVQPLLPEGFQATGPAGPGTVSFIGLETDVCASGEGAAGPAAPMTYASFWVRAEPPPHLRVPGGGAHFVNFDVLVPDEERRSAVVAAGLPARNGTITLRPLAVGQEVELHMEGMGDFRFEVAGQLPNAGGLQGRFTQYTAAVDGTLARWGTDYATTSVHQAAGVVRVPAGSWQADLFGSDAVAGRAFYGRWSYTDGYVEFPVAP